MTKVKVTIGKNEPVIFEGEILFDGKNELGDRSPCQAIELHGVVVRVKNSEKTIRFCSPFCSWKLLGDTNDT